MKILNIIKAAYRETLKNQKQRLLKNRHRAKFVALIALSSVLAFGLVLSASFDGQGANGIFIVFGPTNYVRADGAPSPASVRSRKDNERRAAAGLFKLRFLPGTVGDERPVLELN